MPIEELRSQGEGGAGSPAMWNYHRQVRLRRVARVAKVSGLTMLVLGVVSLLITMLNPLSPEFAISVAIAILGLIEWRLGRGLAAGDCSRAVRLVANQAAVALVVTAYAVWQIVSTTDASVLAVLERPEIRAVFDIVDPAFRAEVINRLPGLIRLGYLLVIPVVWLGSAVMAAYYFLRTRGVASPQQTDGSDESAL